MFRNYIQTKSVSRVWVVLSVFAVGISLVLRLPAFGQLPAGLNRDEAALGYNAYSILKTGSDEWGHPWPVSILSFGDQKLPGYVYTLIPFVASFGLHPAVVRLPSLLAGVTVIVLCGLLTRLLTQSLKWSDRQQIISSFLAMLFIAISPWGMHFSRVAYEAHVAMAFFLAGLTFYWYAIRSSTKQNQRILLVSSAIAWSGSLITYHSYHIFLPLFLIALLILTVKQLKSVDIIGISVALLIGTLAVSVLLSGGILQANLTKNKGITPLSKISLLNQATLWRQASSVPAPIAKLMFNTYTEAIVRLSQNYLSTVSGTFLFVHGSNHGDHNPGNTNNVHIFVGPLFILGLFGLWQLRAHEKVQVFFAWLLLAPVPSALTISPLHEIRIASIFPVIEIIGALGLSMLIAKTPRKLLPVVIAGTVGIIGLSAIRLYVQYRYISPQTAVRTTGYHRLAQALAKYQTLGVPLVTQSPSSSPYIWYLFENTIDPIWLQQNRIAYPPTDEGFVHIQKIGVITFETINWEAIAERSKGQELILFLKPTELSDSQRVSDGWQLLEILTDSDSSVLYEVWKVKDI